MKSCDYIIIISNNIDFRCIYNLLAITVLLIACLSIVYGNQDFNSVNHRAEAQIATTATTAGSLLTPATLISQSRNDPDYLAHVSLEKSLAANPHPVANATISPNQIIRQDTGSVTLDGSKSYDPDGSITRYSWQQIAGPRVRLNSTSTPAVKFNTTCDTLGTDIKFKLIVTGNSGLSDSALVNVSVGYSAKPAICKEAVFSPFSLPLSFTTGKSYVFRVDFGTRFISIDKVAAISTFDAADPFGLGDAYSIANLGTSYHNYLGAGGINNNNNSSISSVNNDGSIVNNTTSTRNSAALKEDFATTAPNNDYGNLTATLTKKEANTTNRFIQGNFASNYSSIKGSFTLTSLKFCVKGTPKIGNETKNNNNNSNMSNLIKPVSFTIIQPTKAAAKSQPLSSKLPTSFKNTTRTNSSVTFDPECNIAMLTPTNNSTALSSIITADDNNTDNANKVNSDLSTGNGSQIGAAQNQQQQQPLLQQGVPYQSSSPPPSLPPQPPYPYTNPYAGPYPYSGPLSQYQQPYPYSGPPSQYQQPYPYPYPPYPYPYPPYPRNQPPIANAGPNQVVNQLSLVTLDGRGSYDPDGGTITSYRWQQISGIPIVTLSGANTATPTFIAPSVLTDTRLTFQLIVTDSDGGGSSSDTVDVLIQRSNVDNHPVANAGPNQVVNQLSLVTLDGTGSYDPNGGTIASYSWIQTAGIPVLLNGANTATPIFTAPVVSFDTILTFTLKVINNNGIVSNNPAIVYITVKSNP